MDWSNYLREHPDATLDQVQQASRDVRVSTYSWLFKTRYHATQDRRIKHMVELRAYDAIGKSWQALGYPFANLTPSYAAAIGASGDRPAALAQLIGVIANGGNKVPTETIAQLDFAKDTPYETHFVRAIGRAADRSCRRRSSMSCIGLLRDVVQGGTAKRLAGGHDVPRRQDARRVRQDRHWRPALRGVREGRPADRVAQGQSHARRSCS